MRTEPIDREECEKLGLLKQGERLEVPAEYAQYGLADTLKGLGSAGVADLNTEQQKRIVDRCAEEGIAVQRGEDALQVLPDAFLSKLEEKALDEWAEREMRRLMQMSEDDILRELMGEDVQGAKWVPQPDGTNCRTKDCRRHKGLIREHKIKTKQISVKYKDARCERVDAGDGKVRKCIKNTTEAISALSHVMSRSIKYQNGKMRCIPGAGAKAPGLEVEFYLSNNSIRVLVKNANHSTHSNSIQAHLTAASVVDQLWEASKHVWQRRDKKLPYEKSNLE